MNPERARLHIEHRTAYTYSAPVSFGIHRLVLRPHEGHRFTVIRQDIAISPGGRITWRVDVHGNHVAYAEITGLSDTLVITNSVEVAVTAADAGVPPAESLEPSRLPPSFLDSEQTLVHAYLKPVWPDEAHGLRTWMQGLPGRNPDANVLDAADWIVGAICRGISYVRRPQFGTQTPAETLRLGTGSCRDFATLAMECGRALGLPSRFVSGYLESSVSAAGQGATHAWVEFYFPNAGWKAWDPTIGRMCGESHLATGLSVHPRGVMPISGTFDGRLGRYLGMTVELTIRRHAAD